MNNLLELCQIYSKTIGKYNKLIRFGDGEVITFKITSEYYWKILFCYGFDEGSELINSRCNIETFDINELHSTIISTSLTGIIEKFLDNKFDSEGNSLLHIITTEMEEKLLNGL
ncbi:MAG: hypothetical protein H8D97_01415 [Proteobacteria bacterium]|nr:hypothetical protein [Pseudomonadota bacterium]